MRLRTSPANRDGHRPDETSGVRQLPTVELDRRTRAGADEWAELQDALLSTGGMLPPPMLVARLGWFIEGLYWEAEEARAEALRRQRVFDGLGRRDRGGAGWELV